METRKKSPCRKCRCSLPAPGAIAGDSIVNLARKRNPLTQGNKAQVIAIDEPEILLSLKGRINPVSGNEEGKARPPQYSSI